MALFRSRNRNVFQPTAYGHSRRKRRVPRWLVLIIAGIILGTGGVLFIQKSYGPAVLTVEESQKLHNTLNSTNMEVQRLQAQLEQHKHDLAQARERVNVLESTLDQTENNNQQLQKDILVLADAVAPDPRGTSPGVRAASFKNTDDALDYSLLIMQDKADSPEFRGNMTFTVQGVYPNGRGNTITLDAIPLAVSHYTRQQGQVALPDGLKARQVTVRITPEGSDKAVAMRVLNVAR